MELIMKNKNFDELFNVEDFLTGYCVGMPVARKENNDQAEDGRVFYNFGYIFCESDESQDFFICKMIKRANQFTAKECEYIRESKGIAPSDEVTEVDAYITGFKNQSAVKVIYDSYDSSSTDKDELLRAIKVLEEYAIDNVNIQIEVTFKNNILKITDIKE